MIDRLEIFAAKLRYLVNRSRWSARLLRAPAFVGHTDEPGLVMIQVDGLGEAVLRRALDEGRMPFTRHLIEDEGHEVHSLYSGLPSNTPAFQAELFYGIKSAVPGFGFIDPDLGRTVAMTQPPAAAAVEGRLRTRAPGLLSGGSSWSNIYAGGSTEAHFCVATAGLDRFLRALHPLSVLGLVIWHFWSVVRVIANFFAETGLAVWDFARGAIAGRDLRMELRFVPERVLVSAVLREIVTAGACVDVDRGVPVVHLNLLGYDEHAHRRGPDSRFALWTLRGIDRTIRRVWLAAHRSRHRDYRVWLYSDHGQEKVQQYSVVYGEDVSDAILRVWHDFMNGHERDVRGGEPPPAPVPSRGTKQGTVPVGAHSPRSPVIREELPHWWRFGRPVPHPAEPSEPPKVGQPTIIHRGPVGFVYLPEGFDSSRRDELAEAIALRARVPSVLVADGNGGAKVWTYDGGVYRLPGDEAAVFGESWVAREDLRDDAIRTVLHEDAGDIVLWSWHPKGAISFKMENGSHGGPGPRETGAFLIVPPESAAHLPGGRLLRAVDLRELAQGALDPARSRLPAARQRSAHPIPGLPKVRLMTYNVHGCRGMDGRFSVERITRVLTRASPDIVCLQEVDQERARSGRLDQVQEIARRLEKSYRFHAVSEVDDGHFGDAVLSSHPLKLVQAGPLPALETRLSLEPRGVLWVEVDVDGVPLQVLTTHLSIMERERRIQVDALLHWIQRAMERGPVLLAGDMNATRDSYVGRRLSSVLHDVVERDFIARPTRRRHRQTYSGRVPLIRIDHVFASEHLLVQKVDVPRSRLVRAASDHLPVVVDFDLAAVGSGASAAGAAAAGS